MSNLTKFLIIHYILLMVLFGFGGTALVFISLLYFPVSFVFVNLFLFAVEIIIALLVLASYKFFNIVLGLIKLSLGIFLLIASYGWFTEDIELKEGLVFFILSLSSFVLFFLLVKNFIQKK